MQLGLNFRQFIDLLEEHDRFDHRFQNMKNRVDFGKAIEQKVIEALIEDYGWVIDPSEESQDIFQKIDGWIISGDDRIKSALLSETTPMQIKYRDTGDDVLMEVVRKWKPDMVNSIETCCTGRDMKGMAKLYAVLNKSGTVIRIRAANEARSLARNLLQRLVDSKKKVITLDGSQIRFTRDPRTKVMKVNAYLNPASFKWKLDYKLNKSIHDVG